MISENIEVNFRLVEYGSRTYRKAIQLREAVLRRPLGLAYTKADLAAEADQLHFVGFMNGEPVACAVLQWIAPGIAKMRQVAIRPAMQRQGLGRRLVKAFEEEARQREANKIMLHARQAAVAFYLRLDYEVIGEPFEEIGIPHQQMCKSLHFVNSKNGYMLLLDNAMNLTHDLMPPFKWFPRSDITQLTSMKKPSYYRACLSTANVV